jgi:hypothetical protein
MKKLPLLAAALFAALAYFSGQYRAPDDRTGQVGAPHERAQQVEARRAPAAPEPQAAPAAPAPEPQAAPAAPAPEPQAAPAAPAPQATSGGDARIAEAIAAHQSDVQVEGEGVVVKLLPDDNQGSRHQRFLLRLSSGPTLLVAHNIDLAPRLNALRAGDPVQFSAIYEWNPKGGVLHWTHRDPRGRHAPGWLKHDGQTYQ